MSIEGKLRADVLTACERGKPSDRGCSLYFVDSDKKFIKIGITENVRTRMHQFKTCSPDPLTLLAEIPMPSRDAALILENMLHGKFYKTRVRGEWFKRDARILRYAEAAHRIGEEIYMEKDRALTDLISAVYFSEE